MTQPIHTFAPPADDEILRLVPPFTAERAHGGSDGEQLFVVRDSKHTHVAGMFVDFGHAQCWALAIKKIYECGFNAGQRARAPRTTNANPKPQEQAHQLALVKE